MRRGEEVRERSGGEEREEGSRRRRSILEHAGRTMGCYVTRLGGAGRV